MLTPQQIESLSLTTEELMQPVIEFLIDDIARRVSKAGQFTSSAAYQIWRAQALGVNRKTIEKELQKKLNISNAEVKKLLKQSAEVGYNFDMKGFGEKGIPFSENKSLQQIIEAAMKMSNDTFKNLTQTIGFVDPYGNAKELTEAYQSSCDYAFNQVTTGATDYNTAIRNATKNLADKGIVSIDYASGIHTSLEAAVRRNIMGGLGLMQEQISQQNHDAFGADGWEISAHSASAPDHEDIQGKQYTDEEFEALNNNLKRRIGTLNCGHAAFPIILGVSEPQYTEKQLKQFKEENKKGVIYNGKHYTTYEATQKQRQIERAIRRQKRRVMVAKGSNDKDAQLISKAKLRRLNEEYGRYSKAVGLPTQRERLFVGKTGVVDMKPHGNSPIYNKAAKATATKTADGISEVKEIKDALDFQYGGFTQEQFWDWEDSYKARNSGVYLSDEELKIIDDYTEGSFISLNDVCRYSDAELLKKGYSAEDIARNRKRADILDGALSKYDLDTDIVTHRFERNVSWLTGKGNDVADLEALVGSEYTAKGFTSSGMTANRFRFTGGKSDAVHFEIVTPKGTNGAYLSMSKKGENEFLYNRNTRFKVLDGGERVVKELKYNFKTGQFDEVDVTERFLKVQVIPDAGDIVKATRKKNVASAIIKTKVVDDVAEEAVETATKKAVKKSAFTPAKTVEEAETHIKTYVDDSHWAGTGVSYKGISVDSANAVNKTLSDLYETFDIEPLGGVYVAKGNTKLGKAVDGATAAYSPIRKSLILNNRSMKDTKHIAEAHAEELRLVELYKKDPKSLVFKSAKAESTMKASVVSGRATVPENVTDVIHHEMGHHIESAIMKSDGYDVIKANMPKYAEKISGYATISESEYIAESFASYLKGEDLIDPALRKVFERMKK
jgi:hypothetical protein